MLRQSPETRVLSRLKARYHSRSLYSQGGEEFRVIARAPSSQYETSPVKQGRILQVLCIHVLKILPLAEIMQGERGKSDQPLKLLLLLQENRAVRGPRSHSPPSAEQIQASPLRTWSVPSPRSTL